MDNLTRARAFFEACDYGKGWSVCKSYCHDDASFETESETLAEIDTLDCLSPVELCQYILAKGVRKHGSEAIF